MSTGTKSKAKPRQTKRRVPALREPIPKLTDEIRAYIVTRLACYDQVGDITTEVLVRWGIDVSHQAISSYNPEGNRRQLAQRWVDLFYATRSGLIAELAAEPIASKALRLRRLWLLHESAYKRAIAGGADALDQSTEARMALEQAAKEVGNVFSNVSRQVGRVDHAHLIVEVSAEERRNMLADRLKSAFAGQIPAQQTRDGGT